MASGSKLKEYLAGALLANAPAWLMSLELEYLRSTVGEIYTALILFFTAMVGGTAAGYLVARRSASSLVRAGMTTGLFSYIIFAIFMIVTGVTGGSINDITSLTGFFIGGAVGARILELKRDSDNFQAKTGAG